AGGAPQKGGGGADKGDRTGKGSVDRPAGAGRNAHPAVRRVDCLHERTGNSMENTMILQVNNLCKNYSQFALQNVSFSLPKGSIMGLIGENGAGKSTTMRLI